jgi:hypothetical protein
MFCLAELFKSHFGSVNSRRSVEVQNWEPPLVTLERRGASEVEKKPSHFGWGGENSRVTITRHRAKRNAKYGWERRRAFS